MQMGCLLAGLFIHFASANEPEARIAVLQWRGTDTDYTDEALQRKLATRLDSDKVSFISDVDLYQPGRNYPRAKERVSPSAADIEQVMALVDETAAMPLDALTEQDWGKHALSLQKLTDDLWFIDREELREPTFLLYAQIGRAASRAPKDEPLYRNIDEKSTNYYWYLAAVLAREDKSLLDSITDPELRENITHYIDLLDEKAYAPLTLSLKLNDIFDGAVFPAEYRLLVNGREQVIANVEGLFEVPLGISDVSLMHRDGSHGLSAQYERLSREKGFEFPRQGAHKRMGLDLIELLMFDPNKCVPDLAGDIVDYMSIYAKLDPDITNYVAVPKFGKTSGKNLMLWRWDVENSQLVLVDPICEGVSK